MEGLPLVGAESPERLGEDAVDGLAAGLPESLAGRGELVPDLAAAR